MLVRRFSVPASFVRHDQGLLLNKHNIVCIISHVRALSSTWKYQSRLQNLARGRLQNLGVGDLRT